MIRKKKIDYFIDKINGIIQDLDLEELKNVKACAGAILVCEEAEEDFEDEEVETAVVNGVCIELYDTSTNIIVYRSKGYATEYELLAEHEEVLENILKIINEDRTRMDICFMMQTFPVTGICPYSSMAKMILNYDRYVNKTMALLIKKEQVFVNIIDPKMSMLKSIFSHQVPPHWMCNDYKYEYHFDKDKCILNIYRNDKLLKTYMS